MPKASANRHIAISPESLWELMGRVDIRSVWDLSVNRFHRDGVGGDMANTRLHYRAPLIAGVFWEWEGAYITYEPPRRTAVQMVSGSRLRPFKRLAGSWVLTEESDGTRLELIVQFESRLPFIGNLVARMITQILEGSLVRLEQLSTGHEIEPFSTERGS